LCMGRGRRSVNIGAASIDAFLSAHRLAIEDV